MSKPTLTHWCDPSDIIASGHGQVTYAVWCELEQARINRHGDKVKIVTRDTDGFIALTR